MSRFVPTDAPPVGDRESMLDVLQGFVHELRAAGLPVSMTENLDAMRAVEHVDIAERDTFKAALGATLVKHLHHWRAFETVFDVYFSLHAAGIGEGAFDERLAREEYEGRLKVLKEMIETEIRRLLVAANPGGALPPIGPEATAFAKTGEPSYAGITGETYVGTDRREAGTATLQGNWKSSPQYVELQNGTGKIILPFTAGEVNLVMQPGATGKAAVAVVLDGKPVGVARGADVGPDGVARFDRSGMIRLVARAPRRNHVLTLVVSDPGLRVYVFTFGP